MRKLIAAAALAAALILPAALAPAPALACDQYVNGYTRSDGTYVSGYYRSCANGTPDDNYSTRGNTNPWTGERGTRDPYGSSSSSYPSVSGGYGSGGYGSSISSYWP